MTKELKDSDANPLLGLTVGQETDASLVGLQGKIKITGGSDKSGVPMRGDILSSARKRVLITQGVGLQDTEKGLRKVLRDYERESIEHVSRLYSRQTWLLTPKVN